MLLTIIPERSYIRKMKMKANFKRGLLCVSALAMSLSCLTSCGKYGAQDLINADVTGFANEADVRDYYIDELKFDSIAVRTADLKTNDYELQTLEDPEKEAEVRDAIARIEEVLSEDVPFSVREKIIARAKQLFRRQVNTDQHKVELIEKDDGYIVRGSISDFGNEIFAVEIYAPNKLHAANIEQNFIDNGEEIMRDALSKLVCPPNN